MNHDLDFLLDPPTPPVDSFRWATVTSVDPIRIRFDGDTTPTPVTPSSLVHVSPGARVWVQFHARMMIILGVSGGHNVGPWVPASLQSGWTGSISARRVEAGVQVLGRVNSPSSAAWSDPICRLPVGLRNVDTRHSSVRFLVWSTSTDYAPKVEADSDGYIRGQGTRTLPGWVQFNEIIPLVD